MPKYVETLTRSIPHVELKKDGLRCVDHIEFANSPEEAVEKLLQMPIVGIGNCGLTFEYSVENNLLARVDCHNILGKNLTLNLLKSLHIQYPHLAEKTAYLLNKLDGYYADKYNSSHSNKNARKLIYSRVAGHNSFFRRFPTLGLPINAVLYCGSEPLAVLLKRARGTQLQEGCDVSELPSDIWKFLGDVSCQNIFEEQHIEGNNYTVIDIDTFFPSNKEW